MTDRKLLEQALDALTESYDLVYNEYREACEKYNGFPSRQARVDALRRDAEKHHAAIYALEKALAEPGSKLELFTG
jgi:hypothetical protein